MSLDSTPTPPPHAVRGDEPSQSVQLGHECPYRDEVHLVRRLQTLGIEEQAIVGRRRDRVGAWLGGAALAAVLALAGWLYVDGRDEAAEAARRDARIEVLRAQATASSSAAIELGRLSERIEGLEVRIGERLTGIEQRMDREDNGRRRR